MSDVTIWHNPRCSKSRKTLALLQEHGIEPTIVEYLKDTPTAAEIDRVLTLLDKQPREIMRTKEAAYAEAGLDDPSLSRAALIEAMIAHPILIERPIVIRENRATIGRPPENALALLD